MLLAWPLLAGADAARIYAASSLAGALEEIAADWRRAGRAPPRLVYAGSATLARQLEAGAPADLFVSADPAWMDRLGARIEPGSRVDLLGNALVLVVPRRAAAQGANASAPLSRRFGGKLCTGEPGVVPLGSYAREALQALGEWEAVRPRLVGVEDARAALAFVERGHCGAGIVYATDARASTRVEVLVAFAPGTHRAIVYPVALMRGAGREGRAFHAHLTRSHEAAATFARHGFRVLATAPQ